LHGRGYRSELRGRGDIARLVDAVDGPWEKRTVAVTRVVGDPVMGELLVAAVVEEDRLACLVTGGDPLDDCKLQVVVALGDESFADACYNTGMCKAILLRIK